MKKLSLLLACSMVSVSSMAQLRIDDDNYAGKTYDVINFQQPVLSEYKSPNQRAGQDASRMVVMCASGGGLRAAAFTQGILMELERIGVQGTNDTVNKSNVANEIDFFSTTSGGGWGVASFISYLYTKVNGLQTQYPTYNSFERYALNAADRDYFKYQLGYLLRGLLGNRALDRRSSITITNRLNMGYVNYGYLRTLYRESHPDEPLDNAELVKLKDVFTLKNEPDAPRLPMFITNTTNVATFSLVPFTPDRLNFWGVKQYNLTASYLPDVVASGANFSTKDLLEMPLALAIKASSSVPGAIGASTFPTNKDGKDFTLALEDGGIVDNFGIHTGLSILRQTKGEVSDRSKRILLVVDAARSGIDVVYPTEEPSRIATLKSIAMGAAPDAQYNITRENIQYLADENNCTVIYLGTEALLNPKLGLPRPSNLSKTQTISMADAERRFDAIGELARKNPTYFATMCSYEDRRMLYEYIRTNIKTWFSAKGTVNSGRVIVDPDKATGYAKTMMLAGRAVVQLLAKDIRTAMDYPAR